MNPDADSFHSLNKNSLLDEITRINEENRQLKEELDIVKKQYADTVDFIPNMTNFYKESTELKKKIIDSQSINDDLQKRLKIALQAKDDLEDQRNRNRSDAEKRYADEVAELQMNLGLEKKENEKMTQIYSKKVKDLESEMYKKQSEASIYQSQISKILKLSGGYFNDIFKTADELIEKLKNGNVNNTENSNGNENDSKGKLENNFFEKKVKSLKSKLHSEKQKRNDLNLAVLKLKNKFDHDKLTNNEKITQLEDHIKQQANEIERLQLLNQQRQIHTGPAQPKLRNSCCQVSLVEIYENTEIENLRHQLLTANSQINDQKADISSLKMKIDDLMKQISDMENSKTAIVEKLKQTTNELTENEKLLSIQKKGNEKLTAINRDLQYKLDQKDAEVVLPQTQLETKLKFVQTDYNNSQSAIQLLEKMFDEQKKEINDLSSNKEKLLMVIEKQNLLINKINEVCLKEAKVEVKTIEKVIAVEPKFKWAIGDLPAEIINIVKEFSENDSLTIESRIKNAFFVISKWAEQQKSELQKERINFTQSLEEIEKEFQKFKSDVISACNDENINEENICNFINNILGQNIDFQKELKAIKDDNQRLLEMAGVEDFETLISRVETINEQNKKLIEKYDQERRKRLGMKKQFKEYVEIKEKDVNDKSEIHRISKENSRKQIERLQSNINKLQKQNKSLIEQMKEIPKNNQNDTQKEDDRDEMYDHIQVNDDANVSNLNTTKVMFENDELRSQISTLNKTLQSWQDAVREAHDENSVLQQKIEQMRSEYESLMLQLNKKSELQNEQNGETIQNLSEKLRAQAEDYKSAINQLNASLLEAHQKYEENTQELNKIRFDNERNQHTNNLKLEAVERAKKLSEAQLKAQILSLDSKHAMQIEETKQKSETHKREIIEFFISTFRNFSNIDTELNEDSFREVVRKVKTQLDRNQRMEYAIRKLIKANDDESLEDSLTQFIIKNHPQFQVK